MLPTIDDTDIRDPWKETANDSTTNSQPEEEAQGS